MNIQNIGSSIVFIYSFMFEKQMNTVTEQLQSCTAQLGMLPFMAMANVRTCYTY